MRHVGRLSSESDARRFTAFLLQQNIDAIVQHTGDEWIVWVRSEDQLAASRAEFERYLQSPQDARYHQAEKSIELKKQEPIPRRRRRRFVWRPLGDSSNRPDAVVALILISTLVTVGSWLPAGSVSDTVMRVLQFADPRDPAVGKDAFHSIKQGELWRLITPIFIHFRVDHILFNMIMFYYFGAQVERLRGPIALGLLMLLLASVSNSAQAYFAGPNFGGMSGVVYGLLGYVWIKSSYDPASGFVIHASVLVVSLIWFFFCLFNAEDRIANYAHVGGLVTGMVIGLAPSRRDEPPTEGML